MREPKYEDWIGKNVVRGREMVMLVAEKMILKLERIKILLIFYNSMFFKVTEQLYCKICSSLLS